MLKTILLAAVASLLSACVPDTPSGLLDPIDPAIETHHQTPPSPTRGLKPFVPAQTKDWTQTNQNIAPSDAERTKGMPSMPGMGEMK